MSRLLLAAALSSVLLAGSGCPARRTPAPPVPGMEDPDLAAVEGAAAALRSGLADESREQDPLEWAQLQSDLGDALATLGEAETGTGRLAEAVTAYRAALEERTHERVPLLWAGTQNRLANTLALLGERKLDAAPLEEAAAIFGQVRSEWSAAGYPDLVQETDARLADVNATLEELRSRPPAK